MSPTPLGTAPRALFLRVVALPFLPRAPFFELLALCVARRLPPLLEFFFVVDSRRGRSLRSGGPCRPPRQGVAQHPLSRRKRSVPVVDVRLGGTRTAAGKAGCGCECKNDSLFPHSRILEANAGADGENFDVLDIEAQRRAGSVRVAIQLENVVAGIDFRPTHRGPHVAETDRTAVIALLSLILVHANVRRDGVRRAELPAQLQVGVLGGAIIDARRNAADARDRRGLESDVETRGVQPGHAEADGFAGVRASCGRRGIRGDVHLRIADGGL